ncbi:MAG: NAD(P)-binding domain-containing protein [Rikenellaceae bacterium]|nr:NAD(P)-binding domain-containing protein [Rikenellaceae bacterium]
MNPKISASSKCAVIGYGSWATAIVKLLCENESCVLWYVANPTVRESLQSRGHNHKYLPTLTFRKEQIVVSDRLDEVVEAADIIILATPSAFLASVLEPLTVSLEGKFVVSAIKGIISDGYQTVTEYIHERYGLPYDNLGVITGPSHAEEVAQERLSYLTVACKSVENAEELARKFSTPFTLTRPSTDIYGLEYVGVFKNIYAMMVGVARGVGYGDNFTAVLVANAAIETKRFMDETYPFERDTNVSAFLGDLLVTSYSQFGRNRAFGIMIGKGYSVLSAKMELRMIAEGYYSAACIHHLNKNFKVDLPIAEALYKILYDGRSPRNVLRELTSKLI